MALSSTARATYLLVAAFLGGGLVGGATMMVVDQNNHERRGESRQRPRSYVDYLTTELDLTSEQRAAVEEILRRHDPRMDSVWAAVRNGPEVVAIRQAIRDDIRSQLTATQQERYTAMLERQGRNDTKGGRDGK